MKAVLCHAYGTADDLELQDLPEPQAGAGEVVVKVAAAALNFFDTLLIAGKYQVKPDFPFSPAAEFAGIVHSIGAGVTGWKPGDRVMSYSGLWRRARILRDQRRRDWCECRTISISTAPPDLSVTYGTTIHALKDRAMLKAGRDARGARCCRRHRPRRDRDRQADGRARDRLRLVGREMRVRETARRRRDRQLRQLATCAAN